MAHYNHVVQHVKNPALESDNTLHVIGVVTNPVRYQSRYRMAREWLAHMATIPNVKVYLVEGTLGDCQPEIEPADGASYKRVFINTNAWVKENLISVGVNSMFPDNWRYMAWVDTDVEFRDPGWAQETMHQLQHYAVVQPWSQCVDLGHFGNVTNTFNSFGYIHQMGVKKQVVSTDPYIYGHPGFAWACTRTFWENLPRRGLMDFCLLGSADWHQAWAMIGEVEKTLHFMISPSYNQRAIDWQTGAIKVCSAQVGFVQGRIEHQWHGSKKRRYYKERNKILKDCGYDPDKNLMYDAQGVIHIINNKKLEYEIHKYNLSRLEDSIDP